VEAGRDWQPEGTSEGRTRGLDVIGSGTRDAILRNLAAQALAGDVSAAREILSRSDPAPRRQEISGDLAIASVEEQRFKKVLSELSNDELQQIRAIAIAHRERIAARSEGASETERDSGTLQ
jgi:hypothetical protein